MMNSTQALDSLGVSPSLLTPEEIIDLDKNGYVVLENILPEHVVEYTRKRLDELFEQEGDDAGSELHQEKGAARLANLLDKDPVFEQCLTTPRVLAGITHIIGTDIQLSSLSSRNSLVGEGKQEFHCDWHETAKSRHFMVCNSAWLFDDMSAENGGTRIVPGSHLWEDRSPNDLEDRLADQPGQANFTGRAGSVVVFNSHIWHAGATNYSGKPRRIVLAYFTRVGSEYIQNDHKALLKETTRTRLSDEALALAAAYGSGL